MSITENNTEGRIAIIGMAGRFPQARDIDKFWDNLNQGVESIQTLTDDELLAAGESQSQIDNPQYVKRAVILEDVDQFDAAFFGYTPKEAEIMDPQQRIFLQVAYHALENAGYASSNSQQRIAIFAGSSLPSYLLHNLLSHPELGDHGNDLTVRLGNDKDFLTTRISYKLNLKGPSININTACSTSLVAVHTACQNLLNYQCDMALAGGITIKSPQQSGYLYQTGGISSPDGHCRAFDASAQGTIGGSGAGIVVLKRLEDALNDGDTIDAVICGSAINNDGSGKVGYTAPSVDGQAEVIAEAQAIAGFEPHTFSYIEAHGTGTSLGDPIEIEALTQAFRSTSIQRNSCAIGSVKTNVGHLDAAAGVCGLIKTVLALKNHLIPASLHFKEPNPNIDFANSPFYVNHTNQAWKASDAHPRRAGVSSFGIGGTNAHVVLEEAPPNSIESTHAGLAEDDSNLFVLSAKSPEAVNALSQSLAKHLTDNPDLDLNHVSWTLAQGRDALSHRVIIAAQNRQTFIDLLNTQKTPTFAQTTPPSIAFLFTGQGSQYIEMGAGLYQSEPTFQKNIDQCAEIIKALTGEDLREIIFPNSGSHSAMDEALSQTAVAQPAIFTIEYSLAQLWLSWGIQPSAMLGHSIGEYVAACLAGVMSLESALMLVTERGRLMQSAEPGSMLAVSLSEVEVQPYLNQHIELAAINGLNNCVISGKDSEIQILLETFSQKEISCSLLHTSHAFHSYMMEPIMADFREKVAAIALHSPKIPFVSNVTGHWISKEEAISPDYWAQHLRKPVRFSQGLNALHSNQPHVFLEVGPGNTLTTLSKRHLNQNEGCYFLSSLRHPREKTHDRIHLLNTLGELWKLGFSIDWNRVFQASSKKRIHLPAYPFECKRYWIERHANQLQPSFDNESRGLPPKNQDVSQWFSIPSWKQSPHALITRTNSTQNQNWVILNDEKGLGTLLASELDKLGHRTICVSTGNNFEVLANHEIRINLANTTDYDRLVAHLRTQYSGAINFIHLASITDSETDESWSKERINHSTERGCASLLFLAQAIRALPEEFHYNIDVITDSMQEVLGQPPQRPELSTVLGPVKVISQESNNISCRSIDLDLNTQPVTQSFDSLLNELLWTDDENIILLRNGQRWIESFESITLPSPPNTPVCFKNGGAYLITGGFGRVGLTLARYLAEHFKARLVLLGRTALPPREQWENILKNPSDTNLTKISKENVTRFNLETEQTFLLQSLREISKDLKIPSQAPENKWLQTSYEICVQLIYESLATSPLDTQAEAKYSKQQICEILGVLPAYHGMFNFMLNTLAVNNRILTQGDYITFEKANSPSATELIQIATQRFPELAGRLQALNHCAKHFTQVINGNIPGVSVLYPDGQSSIIDQFEQTPENDHPNQESIRLFFERYSLLLRKILEKMVVQNPNKKLRILELGAGNLKLTKFLTPALANRNVEYFVTDIGRTFINKAEKYFTGAEYSYMNFEVLDISKNPVEQGFDPYSFDLIVGLNVVHATPNILNTLSFCKQLLAPDGLISLIETVKSEPWDNMIWGLAEDWWHFEDFDLRDDSPLVSLERWIHAFKQTKYQNVTAFPEAADISAEHDCAIIIAQQDSIITNQDYLAREAQQNAEKGESIAEQIKHIQHLEALGSEVICIAADVSDENQMATAFNEAERKFHTLNGIIHTAGTTSGKSIFTPFNAISKFELESQFLPKVQGTLALNQLLKNRSMDFCLLLSSNASVLGGLGLAAYSSANAFLDTFSRSTHTRTKTPFISSNWDGWPKLVEETSPTKHQTSIEAYSMTREEAEIAFASIISQTGNFPQFVVSSGKLQQRISSSRKHIQAKEISATIDHDLPNKSQHQRPNISSEFKKPETETEIALARIWQNLIGIQSIGVLDNFFELGGESLLGTQLISRANKHFNIQLPLRSLFEDLTIEKLAIRIENNYLITSPSDEIEDICPIPDQETYELSFAQRRLWLVCQMSGASVAYNLKYALMLKGEIDKDAFQAAFAFLVKRHESLRTQFLIHKGEPVQCINPIEQINFKIDFNDLTKDPNSESNAHTIAKSEALKPFDLEKDLLIRVSLLELPIEKDTKRHILLFNMHHMISDGWSLKVLVQELSESYNQLITNGKASLTPLPIQYRDFAAWQNRWFASNKTNTQEHYWLNQLGGELPTLELPIDFPRPETQTFNGTYLIKTIEAKNYKKITKFNQQNSISLYVTLLASLNMTLYHHSHQEDIIVGCPVAGRNRIELENQIGFYLNTVAIRNRLDPNMTLGELLQNVRRTATDAFDHQDYPFDQLVEKLGNERDQSRSPLFDVMLNLVLDDEKLALNIEGLSISTFGSTSHGSLFDLNFMWAQTDGHLELWIHYNTDLFKELTVATMAENYLKILNQFIDTPNVLDKPICEFLISEENQQEEAVFMDSLMELDEDF